MKIVLALTCSDLVKETRMTLILKVRTRFTHDWQERFCGDAVSTEFTEYELRD